MRMMLLLKPRSLGVLFLLVILFAVPLLVAHEKNLSPKVFNCVAVFDVATNYLSGTCPQVSAYPPHNRARHDDNAKIALAIELLEEVGFVVPGQFAEVETSFCPLTRGLGVVPRQNVIFLDDGLRKASQDTLAEVIFHELQHVEQMRHMGEAQFKCAYVTAMIDCAGCTDKYHSLEAPAYAGQARVREVLLARWLETSRQSPEAYDSGFP